MTLFFFIVLANRLIADEAEFYVKHESAEISSKSGLIVQEMSKRIVEFGGAALIAGNFWCPYEASNFSDGRTLKNLNPNKFEKLKSTMLGLFLCSFPL